MFLFLYKKVKYFIRENIVMLFLLFGALLFRFFLLPYGNHVDLIINAGWGKWIYENGTKSFYENNNWIFGWPTQLPFINLIYSSNFHLYKRILWYIAYFGEVIKNHNIYPQYFTWLFDLRRWFGTNLYGETPFTNGQIVSMKIIPIFSDG